MTDLLANPAIQSSVVPFVTALLVAALLGFTSIKSARFAGLAVLAGFLGAYVATFGLPPLPAKSSGQKIAYIAILAAFAGLFLEGARIRAGHRLTVGVLVGATSILWIGWRKIIAAQSLDHVSVLVILAGTAITFINSERDSDDSADKAVPLLIVSLAVAGIAFIGSSASISQNAGALAAALGGLLVLNWPKRRFGLGVTARFVPIIVISGLITQTALFTTAPAWVFVLLLPAFYADRLADRWMPTNSHQAPLARPVLLAFLAAIPALAAVWVAASLPGPSGGY